MQATPLVSIIVPVFNDADVIANALDSCLGQSLTVIEVIVVDDASTDDTAHIVEQYAAGDSRVRLIRQEHNASAYQARRVGILAARADHVLFLDGDDELAAMAAETALRKASATGADLVQFGVDVVHVNGRTGGPFEARLQPRHDSLTGDDVLLKLFPLDKPAQGQLWRYLFRTQLLVDAYALMPSDLILRRVNDLPIAFLAAALAVSFESIPDRLYRYHFGRGGSGQKVRDLATASFYAGAIRSIDSIEPAVREIARNRTGQDNVLSTYASVRRAIIAYTTQYLAEHTRTELLDAVFADLYSRASAHDIVQSTATHWPKAIDTLAAHGTALPLAARPVRSVLLATNHLRTGGISGVIISQARLLTDSGFNVTIVAREPGSDLTRVPAGVEFEEVSSDSLGSALTQWAEICDRHHVDLVIDHQWQYSTSWPAFALAARAEGIATIGWSHNFAGRALLFGLDRLESAPRYFALLSHLVVLSPLDVAFWKLRGLPRVSYLPNPPSSLLLEAGIAARPKPAPIGRRIELIWWGRLQQRTKQLTELIDVASHLDDMGVDFRLRIVGPDWRDMTAARLNRMAKERGLGTRVEAIGPLHGAELTATIDSSDLFVNTSIIEGYPLTIPEAQSRGLPVAMYDLPWLALAINNDGIVATTWGDARALAREIASIATDPTHYATMSSAALVAATRESTYDVRSRYVELINNELPGHLSPDPTLGDAQLIIDLSVMLAERYAAARSSTRTTPATSFRALRAAVDSVPWLRPVAQRAQGAISRLQHLRRRITSK